MSKTKLIQPVFLMCSERSGSNLITKIFDAHPDFAGPGTSHLFRVFSELGCRYAAHDPALREDILQLFDAKIGAWSIDSLAETKRQNLLKHYDCAAQMITALMNAERQMIGKTRLFIKENSIYRFLPFLESISEDPSYVFMVRDPRDMALSWHKSSILRGGVVRAANRWVEDQHGFLAAFAWLQTNRRSSILTYENLLISPEEELRRVCADLAIKFSDQMLEFNTHSASARSDAERAEVWNNLARPLMSGNFGKFATELDDEQLAYIESLCGPLMDAFGYRKARASTGSLYAGHDSFASLEASLRANEPKEKPGYLKISQDQRARFERWSKLYAQLQRRPFVAVLSMSPE